MSECKIYQNMIFSCEYEIYQSILDISENTRCIRVYEMYFPSLLTPGVIAATE